MAENFFNDNFMYTIPGIENRAHATRRDNDTFTTPSINLYDIDYAILYHLKNNANFEVEENGKLVTVPVMFAAGEMWTQIQRNGYMRDKSRKLMTPVIALKRDSIANDERFTFLKVQSPNLGNRLLIRPITPDRQIHDPYDWINKTEFTKRNKQYFVSVIPEFIRVSYTLYIWTQLTVQMNSIVEKLITLDMDMWGDSFKFVTNVGDMTFETVSDTGEDRLIRTECILTVDGQLLPEYVLRESTIRKAYSLKRVDFVNEVEQPELYTTPPKIIRSARSRLPLRDLK